MNPRIPKLVAHRGYRLLYPENTLLAVREAVAAGARFVEVDVQLTGDAVPVLFHDRTTERVCGRDGDVLAMTAEEFLALKAPESWRFGPNRYAQEPVASLAAFAQWLAGEPEVHAFVEVKEESVLKHGPEAVHRAVAAALAPVTGRATIISFDTDYLLVARAAGEARLGAVLREWEEREVAAMRTIRPDYLFCDARGIPDGGRLSHHQSAIGIFEVDDARKAMELARRGVDYIETFAVAEMVHALQRAAHRERHAERPHGGGGGQGRGGHERPQPQGGNQERPQQERPDRHGNGERGNRAPRGDRDRDRDGD